MNHSEILPAGHEPGRPGFKERPSSWRARSASRQLLWGKLEENLTLLEIAARGASGTHDPDRTGCIIKQCRQKLAKARSCIEQRRVRPFLFWELIHEADELLLLVLPKDMLPARAVEVQAQFDKKIKDEALRKHWLGTEREQGPLLKTVQRLTRQHPPEESLLPQDRSILQGALHVVNQQVNKGFWQLSMNVAVQVWSGLLLVVLFLLALFSALRSPLPSPLAWLQSLVEPSGVDRDPVISLVLLGAGGAIVSNMLSKESFVLSIGATNRYLVYYVLIKPILGGFAALVVYLLERSALLFEVVIRPRPPPYSMPPEGAPTSSEAVFQIVVDSDFKRLFILAVLAVATGFSAEKWLGGTMDKVLGRIFNRSEKNVSQTSSGASEAEKKDSAQ
jgi:hypothetical protein